MLRLFRKDNELYQGEQWLDTITSVLKITGDVGLLTSATNLLIGMLEVSEHEFVQAEEFVPILEILLGKMESVRRNPPVNYTYYQVHAPWFQVRVLRMIQYFPVELLADLQPQIEALLTATSRRAAGLRPSAAACAKKGASGRMQHPPKLVPIPGCCLDAA